MGEKLPRGSFGRGRSFVKYCAQHLLDVQNYGRKLQKKLAGPHPKQFDSDCLDCLNSLHLSAVQLQNS
jgi:hypothetical protein